MKRVFPLLVGAWLLSGAAHAQIVGKSLPEYTTKAGTVVRVGDTLHLGRGTAPAGGFQYVYVPENMFTSTHQQNFTPQMNNLSVVVKGVRLQRSRNFGEKTVAVIKASPLNGCVDLDAAEAAGEILTAHNPAGAVAAASAGAGGAAPSTADELRKLKKLYDEKVLTRAEYDAQKAKLLR